MQVEHRGYVLQQASNNHYMIIDASKGEMVMHCHCTEKLTEDEAREEVDRYIDCFKNI